MPAGDSLPSRCLVSVNVEKRRCEGHKSQLIIITGSRRHGRHGIVPGGVCACVGLFHYFMKLQSRCAVVKSWAKLKPTPVSLHGQKYENRKGIVAKGNSSPPFLSPFPLSVTFSIPHRPLPLPCPPCLPFPSRSGPL